MSGARRFACAAIAGLLIALAGAPMELSFPALLSVAFLAGALEPTRGAACSNRAALALGLTMGVVTNTISMYWIVELLVVYGSLPTIGAIAIGALLWVGQSGPFVLGAMIATSLRRTREVSLYLTLPASMTLATVLSPAVFPWHFGLSQLPYLEYAQVAELGGLPLLDVFVASVGAAGWCALRDRDRKAAVIALLALALPALFGAVRIAQIERARERASAIAVGVAQPNIGIEEKHDPRRHLAHLAQLRAMTAELAEEGAELVVWPESSYPFPIHRALSRDREGPLSARGDVGVPLLAGVLSTAGPVGFAVALDETGARAGLFRVGSGDAYNSAIGIAQDGRVVGIADKVRLMPFSEHRPWARWGIDAFGPGLQPGVGPQRVDIASRRVGVLNCYEDLMADHVLTQARFGVPDFWANVTNNAWFGDTSAPHLHHMNARMRAIETRRDLVRAVNTGLSGHTSASGRDLARTDAFVRARFVADVRALDIITPWVRFGDWVSIACAALLLVAARRRTVCS